MSIEDRKGGALYDLPLAIARIESARAALDKIDPDIVLVGRSEGYLVGNSDVRATIQRLKAYADAGADVLKRVVEAVAPKPVNILIVRPNMSAKELRELGVRRMSIGGFLGTAASIAFANAAEGLKRNGTLPKEVFSAAFSSTVFALPPSTGEIATAATFIPGRCS